jgi:hypothetical protein
MALMNAILFIVLYSTIIKQGGEAMTFIKVQKLVRNEDGTIASGSAAIAESVYTKDGKYHSKTRVRERLGRVVQLSDDKKSGVFMSETRGPVEYDSIADTFVPLARGDERIKAYESCPEMQVHTVFGDAYMLLSFLEKSGLMSVLRAVFPKEEDYERLLCHVLHGILKNGSKVSCGNFVAKSFTSYVLPDVSPASLTSDTRFFRSMGDDRARMAFFKAFVACMRESDPGFGRGCYVDSTPLPNDIVDNPFNALCCHGVGSSSNQTRLVLVLDEGTGLPVWYDVIPGNLLDLSTIKTVTDDVSTSLDIEVGSLVLDAGYMSKDLVEAFHIGTKRSFTGRMPARKGYPFKQLYWEVKDQIHRGKYAFVRQGHEYFGKCKEISLFGYQIYAYVYVDQNNALRRFRDCLVEHPDEFAKMKDKDKDWASVKNGFFVLLSNLRKEPADILSDYFGRSKIESVFKASKEYLDLLPLSKWTEETVRGKILHDIIDTIILLQLRKAVAASGISISELVGKTQSLMCNRDRHGLVNVQTPNKKTREYYKLMGLNVPAHVKIDDFKREILRLKM